MDIEMPAGPGGLPHLYALLESTRVAWLPESAGALLSMAFVPKSGLRLLTSCIEQVHLWDYEEVCLAKSMLAAESRASIGDLLAALRAFRDHRPWHAKSILAAAIVTRSKRLRLDERRWLVRAIGEVVISPEHGHARAVLLSFLAMTPSETSVRVVQALRTDVLLGAAATRAWRRLRVLDAVPEVILRGLDALRHELGRMRRFVGT